MTGHIEPLTVVANTGDDAEVYGVHVSPDPDLVAAVASMTSGRCS